MSPPPAPYRLPMFPLGSVLVPTAVLPLHLFEPRYLALLDEVRASDPPELGVVLIVRGSEVGGGDVRTDVGTVARLLSVDPLPGDRWSIVVGGVRRLRVVAWARDDPYPSADVVDWPDADGAGSGDPHATADLAAAITPVVDQLRTSLALAAELGERVPPRSIALSDDPVVASLQVGAVAPIGPADQQRLLAVPGAAARVELAGRLLGEIIELQRARLALP